MTVKALSGALLQALIPFVTTLSKKKEKEKNKKFFHVKKTRLL